MYVLPRLLLKQIILAKYLYLIAIQVIVGENGSGKSTILKLCVRLYDPQQGEILLDGKNIRELKLADLRNAMSVLFQNFTHFPLSVGPFLTHISHACVINTDTILIYISDPRQHSFRQPLPCILRR